VRAKEEGEHLLFSLLTTEGNDVVHPIHAKAIPVMLTEPDEWEAWLTGPVEVALALQRPLPGGQMRIVASGQRKDGLEQVAE
jgi:putative SOS response-associated peptidase YedK